MAEGMYEITVKAKLPTTGGKTVSRTVEKRCIPMTNENGVMLGKFFSSLPAVLEEAAKGK